MVSRANQDLGLCKRLLEGHKRVLEGLRHQEFVVVQDGLVPS